jgi:hypothetical protein
VYPLSGGSRSFQLVFVCVCVCECVSVCECVMISRSSKVLLPSVTVVGWCHCTRFDLRVLVHIVRYTR